MIIKSISYVTVGLILGRLAAFIKHAIIVKYAGISFSADAFFVANTLPETVINVILAGILTGAFIPLASQELTQKGMLSFKQFVNNSIYFLGFLLIVLSSILYFFSGELSQFMAPGYDLKQQQMIDNILKIFSPGIFFAGMAAILTGILQSLEKFFVPSFGLLIANTTTIISTIVLFKKYGIYAAAIGTSFGFFLWFFFQIPSTLKYLIPASWPDIRNITFRRLIYLTIPTILIIAISNSVLIIEKIFASRFLEGTVTQLNLAFRLTLIFANILVLPLSTVLLPKMSKQYTKDNLNNLYDIIYKAFSIVSIFLFVIIILILINAHLITQLVYFPLGLSDSTIVRISEYLRIYAFAFLGLFFYPIVLRLFFSVQKVKNLMIASILGFLSYAVIILILISEFSSYILPFGYGVFYFIIILYLFWIMSRKIFPNHQFFINKSILQKGSIITVITVSYLYLTMNYNIDSYIHFIISMIFIMVFIFLIRKQVSQIIIPHFKLND
jgi:putative peptidoglycan lipid II flippase